jgi:AraC-like DNA-binding protein
MHRTRKSQPRATNLRLDQVGAISLGQIAPFAGSYLPLSATLARRHLEDMEELLSDLPRQWPLEDRLVAHFYPEFKSNIFSYYLARGPDLAAIVNERVRVDMDSGLAQRIHEALLAQWASSPQTMAANGKRRARRALSQGPNHSAEGGLAQDINVTMVRGAALISLAEDRRARWTSDHCNQVLQICTALFARQEAFLKLGFEHLAPMSMKDVAADAGVHESTVQRHVRDLLAMTPHGFVKVSDLFGGGLPTLAAGLISSHRQGSCEEATLQRATRQASHRF